MEEFFDLTGKRFGRWTVTKYNGKNEKGDKLFECKCECGTVKNVLERSLKSGSSKSCGCLKKDLLKLRIGKEHPNFKDITGQRFGRLVVLGDSGKRESGLIIWECQCDCGNVTYVYLSALKSGRTRSCGCLQKSGDPYRHIPGIHEKVGFMDLTGKKFGRLFVKKLADGRGPDGGFLWKCICDCGKETVTEQKLLLNGNSQSCGCLRNERVREAKKRPEYREKISKIGKEKWDESAKKIGMQDDTNISIMKSDKVRVDSSTGIRGVTKKREGQYIARLTFRKKKYVEYGFKTAEEAKKARDRMYQEIVVPYLESVGRT